MPHANPASWLRRLNAATLDGIVCAALMAIAAGIGGHDDGLRLLRLTLVFGPIFLLEPLLLRSFGTTVGQHFLALRVTPAADRGRLSFLRLLLRYWMKLALGGVSLLYILFSGRRQALHDRAFGTLVWHVPKGAQLPRPESWTELPEDPALPSATRRFVAFVAWSLVAQLGFFVVASVAIGVIFGATGLSEDALDSPLLEFVFTLSAAGVELWVLRRALSGRLPGAQRRERAEFALPR